MAEIIDHPAKTRMIFPNVEDLKLDEENLVFFSDESTAEHSCRRALYHVRRLYFLKRFDLILILMDAFEIVPKK